MCTVDLKKLTPIQALPAIGDAEEAAELEALHRDAAAYLRSFHWCPELRQAYLGEGVPGIFASFLFELKAPIPGTEDDCLWVVVGDLPSAYFVVDDAPTPRAALEVYCELMDDWIGAVREGTSLEEVYPVAAEPTEEHAAMLASRLTFLREEIIR
ncbi:MAG: hypothetical protein RL885_24845 [Planctomycetota bacterium]